MEAPPSGELPRLASGSEAKEASLLARPGELPPGEPVEPSLTASAGRLPPPAPGLPPGVPGDSSLLAGLTPGDSSLLASAGKLSSPGLPLGVIGDSSLLAGGRELSPVICLASGEIPVASPLVLAPRLPGEIPASGSAAPPDGEVTTEENIDIMFELMLR